MAGRHLRSAGLIASTLEAQVAMWTTLGIRVPQLMAGTMSAAERHRMVAEKAEAVAESAQATAMATGRMMLDPGALRSPSALMAGMLTVSQAAAKPFQTRVKANAKRLTKPGARSSRRIGKG